MNVIFLDFNGVLDTNENMDVVNYDNLIRLKYIVDETDSKVVITSSLKNSYYYTERFSKLFLNIVKEIVSEGIEVIDITPKANTREEEIKLYLEKHLEIENFCIIDDDYYMDIFKEHMVKLPNQIEIGQVGLDDEHMHMAIRILKKNK